MYELSSNLDHNVVFVSCIGKWSEKDNLYLPTSPEEQLKCGINNCEILFEDDDNKKECIKLCNDVYERIKKKNSENIYEYYSPTINTTTPNFCLLLWISIAGLIIIIILIFFCPR